ncbi:MAG: CBS domain-containing protein [Anaerolineales bacterium]|nr:CBS domain-containing protein [Anaerolineales bacterium]MCB9126520.1 CBS domain-containing protein [Ardenticatenales bacterium]
MKQIKMVRDLMYESPPTVGPHESLGNAGRLMMESRQKRLAVVDEGGRLVGLISDRDLRLAADSPLLEESASEMLDTLQNHHVREIMTTAVHTIEAEAPVVEAAQLMRVAEVGGLPVVEYDESGNDEMLVGMITQQQLLDYLIVLLSDEEP